MILNRIIYSLGIFTLVAIIPASNTNVIGQTQSVYSFESYNASKNFEVQIQDKQIIVMSTRNEIIDKVWIYNAKGKLIHKSLTPSKKHTIPTKSKINQSITVSIEINSILSSIRIKA